MFLFSIFMKYPLRNVLKNTDNDFKINLKLYKIFKYNIFCVLGPKRDHFICKEGR